jgi:pullulanase
MRVHEKPKNEERVMKNRPNYFSPTRSVSHASACWRMVCAIVMLATAQIAFALAHAAAPATVRIHYNRADGQAATWQLYTWYGALNPSPQWVPAQAPNGSDAFGVYYDVPIKLTDAGLNFILHNADGSQKNCNDDRYFPFPADIATAGADIWALQDDCTIYTAQPVIKVGDVTRAKAHFVTRDTIAWPGGLATSTYALYAATAGGITTEVSGVIGGGTPVALTVEAAGLPAAVTAKFPHLAGALALKVGAADRAKVAAMLKGQVIIARSESGALKDATALQIPGVLDDLYNYRGQLGAVTSTFMPYPFGDGLGDDLEQYTKELFTGVNAFNALRFRLWAPTAQSVAVRVYDDAGAPAPSRTIPMQFNAANGVWYAGGDDRWVNAKYYRYEVKVFVRGTGKVETNIVTDPYSLSLAANGAKSLIVDLDSSAVKPKGWGWGFLADRPSLRAPEDIVLYELHLRDFSASDGSVPAADRGKYRAFTHKNSAGMKHLKALQDAGLTHIHLLPVNDSSSLPETGCATPAVPAAAPDSQSQQAAIFPVRDQDCFNWAYDPVHYAAPEGSYASTPNGIARVLEFREMVKGLHDADLRVVMDVVYNHTADAGQGQNSVLDKIVPGYYHRLDGNGFIANSTCCANTATEHAMMGKLMIDSLVTWARDYKVDGFRFDLMGHQPKELMVKARQRLREIDPAIYLYGEGWNFGEVANNARFVQATQANMAGTGIGTFSDRMRDAVRGGGPFDGGDSLIRNQGFSNGLWYDNNALAGAAADWQRDLLNRYGDWIRLGLTGTLKDYVFTDKDGATKTGAQIDYNGQPAGYTTDPQEVINYISAHDNQTLFDNNQFKMPTTASLAERVRVNNLGVAIVGLSQGIPFFHAGDDILRSKSLDRDSYNSGDWFNRIDWTYQTNNWAVGLPPSFTGNADNWGVMAPLLANPALKVGSAEITSANAYFRDILEIRKSSGLFRLNAGAMVKSKLKFHNVGPSQVPGVIVMQLSDDGAPFVDGKYRNIVVVFNATKTAQTLAVASLAAKDFKLHPVQKDSKADMVVKGANYTATSGTFTVPARTTAVFVDKR